MRMLARGLKHPNNLGFSLVEIMISVGIMGVVSMGILSVSQLASSSSSEASIRMTAESIKRNLVNYIQNPTGWTNTINLAANTNLACLKNSTDCTGVSGNFKVMDSGPAGGTLVYDATVAANGFDLKGKLCSTFDTTNITGNNKCPFRVDITWTPVCSGASNCTNPGVKVTGTMYYRPKKQDATTDFPLNPSRYSFSTIRGATDSTQGTGTTNYLARWSATNILDDSVAYQTSGKIGIGTTVPLSMLQVTAAASGTNATLILDGSLTDNKNSLFFRNSYWSTATDAYGMAYIRAVDSGTQGGHLAFATTANSSGTTGTPTERMRISEAGNVGIGSTVPAAKLDVNGQIKGGFVSHSSLNTNWSSGNIQLTSVAAGTLTFTSGSMLDGANYVLVLTSAGTFTLGTAGDITTWKCSPTCASNQIVAVAVATTLTIVKAGTTGYVAVSSGIGTASSSSSSSSSASSCTSTGLTVHLPFDESANATAAADYTGNGYSGTLNNFNTATCWVAGKIGNAISLDGTNDYVTVNPTNLSDLGGSATIAYWINQTNANGLMVSHKKSGMQGWAIDGDASSTWFGYSSNDGWQELGYFLSAITNSAWTHIAVTIDRTNSLYRTYMNGALQSSVGINATPLNNALPFYIGSRGEVPDLYANAKFDDFRFYTRALGQNEINGLYNGGTGCVATAPSCPVTNLAGWWKFNEASGSSTAADSSGNTMTGSLVNTNNAAVWVAGKNGNALELDGVNDQLNIAYKAPLNITGQFSIALWVYKTGATNGNYHILNRGNPSPDAYQFWFFGGKPEMVYCSGAGATCNPPSYSLMRQIMSSSAILTADSWEHYAITYNDTSNTTVIYRNGSSVATDDWGTGFATNSMQSEATLGLNIQPDTTGFKIDDLRIYSAELSSGDVTALYNGGAGCP